MWKISQERWVNYLARPIKIFPDHSEAGCAFRNDRLKFHVKTGALTKSISNDTRVLVLVRRSSCCFLSPLPANLAGNHGTTTQSMFSWYIRFEFLRKEKQANDWPRSNRQSKYRCDRHRSRRRRRRRNAN